MIRKKFLITLIVIVSIACVLVIVGMVNKSEIKRSLLSQELQNKNKKISFLRERLNQEKAEKKKLAEENTKLREKVSQKEGEIVEIKKKLDKAENDLSILGDYLIKAREEARSYKEKVRMYEDKLEEEKKSNENLERLLEIEKTLKEIKK